MVMESRLLNVFASEMPAIYAREQISLVNAVAAGTPGAMAPSDRRSYMSALELAANHGTTPQRREVHRLASPEAQATALAAMGITIAEPLGGSAS